MFIRRFLFRPRPFQSQFSFNILSPAEIGCCRLEMPILLQESSFAYERLEQLSRGLYMRLFDMTPGFSGERILKTKLKKERSRNN